MIFFVYCIHFSRKLRIKPIKKNQRVDLTDKKLEKSEKFSCIFPIFSKNILKILIFVDTAYSITEISLIDILYGNISIFKVFCTNNFLVHNYQFFTISNAQKSSLECEIFLQFLFHIENKILKRNFNIIVMLIMLKLNDFRFCENRTIL